MGRGETKGWEAAEEVFWNIREVTVLLSSNLRPYYND